MTTKTPQPCKHPPHRLFSWWAKDSTLRLVLCVVCLECHGIISGGAE